MSVDVHGFCDEKFAGVREAFAANLESGADVGATFAATIEGESYGAKACAAKESTAVWGMRVSRLITPSIDVHLPDRGVYLVVPIDGRLDHGE